jgi:phosphoserine phosphatase
MAFIALSVRLYSYIFDSKNMPAQEIKSALIVQNLPAALQLSDYKLMAFDMDSTLINIECIDEIADAAGRKAEVAAITEAAMRGEITDFKDSLRRRLALLKGVSVQHMEAVYTERLRYNPGAQELIRVATAAGLTTLLVSGGFTFFADRVRAGLGMTFARANQLEVVNGHLTGQLVAQCWGDICDGAEKRRTLLEVASLMGIPASQTIAVGDGANDLPMMGAAGLSVAYHAKPKVREQAHIAINEGGLDRLLEVVRPTA